MVPLTDADGGMKGEMAEERARESEGVREGEEVGGGERERERE